jgi:hypothetical protein
MSVTSRVFLNLQPNHRPRRLTVLRQFFRFARTRRLVLINPTRGLARKQPKGFRGTTLTIDQQRLLFRRWTTDPTVHPYEAHVGILALLHGACSQELQLLRRATIDPRECTIRLGGRPHPVPLDPASWAALTRCLAHRQSQHTRNPHVIVTKVTKTGREPASAAYLSHVLDACGLTPHSPGRPRQHHGPQAGGCRVRHGTRGRNDLPRRPRRPHPIADQRHSKLMHAGVARRRLRSLTGTWKPLAPSSRGCRERCADEFWFARRS